MLWRDCGITCSFNFRCSYETFKKLKRIAGMKKYKAHIRGGQSSRTFSVVNAFIDFDDQAICEEFISVFKKLTQRSQPAAVPGDGRE